MSLRANRICLETATTQETTIEKLCDDVLVEIFSYLSAEELKSASLVCKHWNEVIGSSVGTMKKFKLKLKESELIGRQFRSTRKYQNIELEMLARTAQKSLQNLDRGIALSQVILALSQVKYFKIFAHNQSADPENAFADDFDYHWQTFSIDAVKLTSVLKQMKQLQELYIECPDGFRGSFTSTIDLPKLTKLAVKSPDMSIFQGISASNVTEVDVIHQSYRVASDVTAGVQHLASFLKLCKQITTLKLNSSLFHYLYGDIKWKDFNLKLSGLDIDLYANTEATSLREFLISQAPSLTSLKMKNGFRSLSASEEVSVIKTISQLKNLKILSLDYRSDVEVTFLRQLPELEQLTLYKVNDINSIARFNRKLTYLKVDFVGNSLDAALEFSELRHLCIGFDPSLNCLKVIKGSPRVETIELRLSFGYRVNKNRCDEAIEIVLQRPTLRHFKLEYRDDNLGFRHLEIVFDSIANEYGNLKSLSLSKKVGSGWRSLEFLFPENRSEWKADEQKQRLMETFGSKY